MAAKRKQPGKREGDRSVPPPQVSRPINDRQRRFCELVVQGVVAGRAYESAGYAARGDSADQAASRMLGNVKVAEYLGELRARAQKSADFTIEEGFKFLADVIRTPIGQIDEHSPLCQEYTREPTGGPMGQLRRGNAPMGNEVESPMGEKVKFKMPSKMDAFKQMALMMGWNKPAEVKVDATAAFADMLKRLRGTRK